MSSTNVEDLRAELAPLRAALADHEAAKIEQGRELAALRGELAAMRAARPRRSARRVGLPRRFLAALSLALMVALVPLTILAANPFTDLTGGVHDPNIDAIYNAGVTTGCVPNAEYCPTANVTREEMASFLARLGGLGNNQPVANAKTAQTATTADTATNAGMVDGKNANDLVRIAHNSNSLAVGLPDSPGLTLIIGTTITVPGPGFVLVTGVATIGGDGIAKTLLREPATGTLSDQKGTRVDPSINLATISMQHVFEVTTAGQKTFQLMGQKIGGTAVVAGGTPGNGNAATITAIYIPFGSTGTTAP